MAGPDDFGGEDYGKSYTPDEPPPPGHTYLRWWFYCVDSCGTQFSRDYPKFAYMSEVPRALCPQCKRECKGGL